MCRVISVSNQKGGVSKSTTVMNLGVGLARHGKKVLLIDGDPQGSLTASMGYPEPDDIPDNYIVPLIGDTKLNDVNTRFLEKFYQSMTQMPGHINPISKKGNEHISPSTIRDIHKLLRSAFQQAVKWELMDKNPAAFATTPKWKKKEREIWTAETVMYALEVCKDERLKLAIGLAFSCSLRLGELLGLTWDCIDI